MMRDERSEQFESYWNTLGTGQLEYKDVWLAAYTAGQQAQREEDIQEVYPVRRRGTPRRTGCRSEATRT